jgi:hypothetical protein
MSTILEILSEPNTRELIRKLRDRGVVLEKIYRTADGPTHLDSIISIVRQWSRVPRDAKSRMDVLNPVLDRAGVEDQGRRNLLYLAARDLERKLRGEDYE